MRTLVFLFILILGSFSSCKFIKQKGWFGKDQDTTALHQQRMNDLRVADSLKKAQAEQIRLDQIADSLLQIDEAQRLLEEQYKYHIIVGGFITPEYADAYSDYYASLGYQPRILTAENGFDLISVMDLDNRAEASRMVESFRDTVDIDTWLYIYPNR